MAGRSTSLSISPKPATSRSPADPPLAAEAAEAARQLVSRNPRRRRMIMGWEEWKRLLGEKRSVAGA